MGAAAIGINLATQAIGILGGLLGQHTARLKDAQSENSAVPQAIQALNQDLQEIAAALTQGAISPAQAEQALSAINAQILQYLHSLVGKPGTAWSGSPSGCPGSDVPKTENGAHPCNKACTVGCCVYYNYLEPAIDCFAKRLAKTQPGGSFGVAIPAIPTNKYGLQSFPAITFNVTLPKHAPSSPGSPASVVNSVVGASSVLSAFFHGGASPGATSDSVAATRNSSRLMLYAFGGLLALVAILFAGRK